MGTGSRGRQLHRKRNHVLPASPPVRCRVQMTSASLAALPAFSGPRLAARFGQCPWEPAGCLAFV